MNIVFNTPEKTSPITFKLASSKIDNSDVRNQHLYSILFGETKTCEWLQNFLYLIHNFELTKSPGILNKVKLLSILFYTITYNLLNYDYSKTRVFLERNFNKASLQECLSSSNKYKKTNIEGIFENDKISWELHFGFNIILEVYELIKFYLYNFSNNKYENPYVKLLLQEINNSVQAMIKINDVKKTKENFDEFFNYRIMRLNAKVILLIEICLAEEEICNKLSNNKIDIDEILAFGRYIEIKTTLIRDFMKRSEEKPLNSYNYYEKFFDKNEYLNYQMKERSLLLEKFKDNELLMNLLTKFEKNFEENYTALGKKEKNDINMVTKF